MDSMDPRAVIYEFLAELPDMIRTDELFFVLLYCCRRPSPLRREEYLADVETYLKQDDIAGINAVIDAMEVIDYQLSNAELSFLSFESQTKKNVNAVNVASGEGLLGLALMRKHYADALDKWKTLTLNQLSEQSIRAFREKTSNPPGQQITLPHLTDINLSRETQASNPPNGGLLSRCLAYLTRIHHQHG